MAKPTPEKVKQDFDRLASMYSQRNQEYSILRQHFDGDLASTQVNEALGSGDLTD